MWFPTALFPTTWCTSKSRVLPSLPSSIIQPEQSLLSCLFLSVTHPSSIPSKSPSLQTPAWQKTIYAMPWCQFCMCQPVQRYVVKITDIQEGKPLHWIQPRIPPWLSSTCQLEVQEERIWGFWASVNCHRQRAVSFSSDSSPSGINLGVRSGSNSL